MPELKFVSTGSTGKLAELKAVMRWPNKAKKQKIHIQNYLKNFYIEQTKKLINIDYMDDEQASLLNMMCSVHGLDKELLDKMGGLDSVMHVNNIPDTEETTQENINKMIGICILIMYINKRNNVFVNKIEYSSLNRIFSRVEKGEFVSDIEYTASATSMMKYWATDKKKNVAHLLAANFVCDKIIELSKTDKFSNTDIGKFANLVKDDTFKFGYLMGIAHNIQQWGLTRKSTDQAKDQIFNEKTIYAISDEYESFDIPKGLIKYFEMDLNECTEE